MAKPNTRNLMDFGPRELKLAGYLLLCYRTGKDHTERLGFPITPEFNPNSKIVFLVDTNFHVAVISQGYLCDWFICDTCQYEGLRKALMQNRFCCNAYLKTIFHVAA